MILVSIHPFACRKLLLVILGVIGFAALCFADPVLLVRQYSPDSRRHPAVGIACTAPGPVVSVAGNGFEFTHLGIASLEARNGSDVEKATMRVSLNDPFNFSR